MTANRLLELYAASTVHSTTPDNEQTSGILQLLIVEKPRRESASQTRPPITLPTTPQVKGMAATQPVLPLQKGLAGLWRFGVAWLRSSARTIRRWIPTT